MKTDVQDFSFKGLFIPFSTTKAIVFIIVIGLAVFSNSLLNGFAGDDFGQLVDNNIVHSLRNLPLFFLGGTFNNGNGAIIGLYYKPLLLTVYSLLYSLIGANSFFYHAFQLLLHISNVILVFIIFKKFFKKEIAFFLALIFLVHPINADTVDYVANLQDILFTFFGLIAVYLIIFKQQKPLNVFLAGLSFFLSLLSKETGLAFAFMSLTYCYLFDRVKLRIYLFVLPALAALYGILHIFVLGIGFSNNQPFPIMRLNLAERLINIPAIFVYYLKTFFFPLDLAVGYQWTVKTVSFSGVYLPLLIVLVFLGLCTLLFLFIKNNSGQVKLFVFFSIWFSVGMLLHLQIIPLDFTATDRWMYFPIIGLLGFFGIFLSRVKLKRKNFRQGFYIFCLLIIISLSFRTIIRNQDWKNGVILAEHDLKYSPENYALENYLGVEYYNLGRYDKAQKHFTKSTKLAPYWDLNWNYLGQVLEREGSLKGDKQLIDQARQKYKIAIKNSVSNDAPFVNYSHLLVFSADPLAKDFIEEALKKYPRSSGLWYYLAILDYSLKNQQQAIVDARNAYLFDPYNQEAKTLYAALLNGTSVNINIHPL